MRTLTILIMLIGLSLSAAAQEQADWTKAAGKRLELEQAHWAKSKPLAGKDSPSRDPEKGEFLCPKDRTKLIELRRVLKDKEPPSDDQIQGLFCPKEQLLYHVSKAEDQQGLAFRGPLRVYIVTQAVVLKALQRHTTDSDQQGFYTGRYRKLIAMGPEVAEHLVTLFNEQTSRQVRMLAIEALGEMRNRSKTITDMLEKVVRDPTAREYGFTAMVSLAKLGQTEIFDAQVKRLQNTGQDLLRENDERGQAYSALAGLWSRMGKQDKALACYKKAIEMAPNDKTLRYNLACSYAQMGKLDEAFKSLDLAIDKGFDHWEWMRMDGDLKPLHKDPRWKKALKRQHEKKNEPR